MKDTCPKCALVLVADGFEETETVSILSLLRQAGLYVKSVGLTSGLVGGAHGIWMMPDLTLADLDQLAGATINLVVLPEGKQSLTKLEADPRVHRLLRQIVAQRGQIVTTPDGLRVTRAAAVWGNELGDLESPARAVALREPEQTLETFVLDLVRRLR